MLLAFKGSVISKAHSNRLPEDRSQSNCHKSVVVKVDCIWTENDCKDIYGTVQTAVDEWFEKLTYFYMRL